MTAARKIASTAVLIAAIAIPLSTWADPPATAPPSKGRGQVTVIRGSSVTVEGGSTRSSPPPSRSAPSASQQEHGVIVMRPAPDSFLRETKRLVAQAEAREERLAREESEEAASQLVDILQRVTFAPASDAQGYPAWWTPWPVWRPQLGKFPPPVRPMPPPLPPVGPNPPHDGPVAPQPPHR
jgi:hypothetical protein